MRPSSFYTRNAKKQLRRDATSDNLCWFQQMLWCQFNLSMCTKRLERQWNLTKTSLRWCTELLHGVNHLLDHSSITPLIFQYPRMSKNRVCQNGNVHSQTFVRKNTQGALETIAVSARTTKFYWWRDSSKRSLTCWPYSRNSSWWQRLCTNWFHPHQNRHHQTSNHKTVTWPQLQPIDASCPFDAKLTVHRIKLAAWL